MIGAALLGIRHWFRLAYWIYAIALALVVAVDLRGFVGMGAQRWIDLGVIQLQPSELMNIALVLALARYFHARSDRGYRPAALPDPAGADGPVPAALVLKQPDLGTAMMLLLTGAALFFIAGVRLRIFALMAAAAPRPPCRPAGISCATTRRTASSPFSIRRAIRSAPAITSCNRRSRSARAASSARAFCNGSQSHLSFLPEKQTDFIFTMLAEEFGFIGGLGLLALYTLIIGYGFAIALRCRNHFGRLLGLGIVTNFSLYVFINTAMVMGLIPVVGVPLPLISYGGTAMLTVMFGFGLLMNVGVHRSTQINRRGEARLVSRERVEIRNSGGGS